MSTTLQKELHAFTAKLLERRGGLVDWPEDAAAGTAVVPPDVAAVLPDGKEEVRLSEEGGGPGWSVNLAGEFMETAGRLLEPEPRIGAFRLPELYLKRSQLEEALAKTFSWLNVRVRPRDISATSLEYHTWRFLATLASEDRWEALTTATVNAASGAVVDLPDPLALWELQPGRCVEAAPHDTFERAASAVGRKIRAMAGEFIARMEGRLQRDRKRLRDYYNAMLREANARKSRPRHVESAEEIEAGKMESESQKRAVDLELRRKLIELDQRYAMEATLRPLVLIRTEMPVMRIRLEVLRKQAKRIHDVYWNPLLKHFEPLPCSRCLTESFALAFSNEKVAPLCSSCWSQPTADAKDHAHSG
ncbi:MAG: hypothetical protein IT426_20120 [Pirellulales bacterium]|nr:hypothetical protein [Pirellulales bacterium]